MDLLWSASTTMRNPERAIGFLKTISELENEEWTYENQIKYQILLIKNRYYVPNNNNLSNIQTTMLEDYNTPLSYENAKKIFDNKKYIDGAMRGRTSFDPLEKLGLAYIDTDNKITISSLGKKLLLDEITLEEVISSNLLKMQYPNPLSTDCKDYNTKPFINVLRLIRKVNGLCTKQHKKVKGISKEEFGIFCLSIKDYREVDKKAKDLLEYRNEIEKIDSYIERKKYREWYVKEYLKTFKDPIKNTVEYADNIIRYIRMTKYIYFVGAGYYIDLEPRRLIEIKALLANDDGSAKQFTKEEYINYLADENAYVLPFENYSDLVKIGEEITFEINNLNARLKINKHKLFMPDNNITDIKKQIEDLREERKFLQGKIIKHDYENIDKIDLIILSLKNIRKLEIKPSIALEKWISLSLVAINDAVAIKPNAPMGDDYEPIFTAPAGVPDIECYYKDFGLSCEVTMLNGRDQWYNEGQPVMRHLRNFENKNNGVDNYCIFIAPSIHKDTLNTFWMSVKYEYEGKKQKIIPLSIEKFIDILNIYKKAKMNNKVLLSMDMKRFYDKCCDVNDISTSNEWQKCINDIIDDWKKQIL